MSDYDFHIVGTRVELRKLTIPRARSVATFARTTKNPHARLLNCYGSREDGTEAVALAISATVPQRPAQDIRQTEPILITFPQDDGWYPYVESLRKDFPYAPHTNLTGRGEPRSLCLYDQPWEDVRVALTAPKLIARIMWWLEGTAAGSLHGNDQALEPLVFDPRLDLIVPSDLMFSGNTGEPEPLICYTTGWSLRLVRPQVPMYCKDGEEAPAGSCLALVITCQPQQHGVIQATPQTLSELHDFLIPANVDLLKILRDQLDCWIEKANKLTNVDGVCLILLVRLPKTRVLGGEVESEELRAFAVRGSIGAVSREVRRHLDATDEEGLESAGEKIELVPLNPRPGFSRAMAAEVNGELPDDSRVIAVGAGALGSQVATNLVRGGFGQWTLVDHDLLQPHNLGRHALGGWALGMPKVSGLTDMLNNAVEGPQVAQAIPANVLRQPECVDWKSGDIILDLSASIAVARHLCHNIESSARRVSLFLNPSGKALTLLAEDRARNSPLDVLEMQHYRALICDPNLGDLLSPPPTMRSGAGCRDVSTQIPQDLVGIHAGIGSRAVRRAVETDRAQISIWIVDESNYSVTNTTIEVVEVHRRKENGWHIYWDAKLESKLRNYRNAKLPNETGGVLIGAADISRRIMYVVDATEAPPDSQECPNGFLRGLEGLQEDVVRIEEATGGMLGYIGEWHSHPAGNVQPSTLDKNVVKWVKETLDDEGQVGVVGIVGSRKKFNLIPCGTALYQ